MQAVHPAYGDMNYGDMNKGDKPLTMCMPQPLAEVMSMLRFPRQYTLWVITLTLLILAAGCSGAQSNTVHKNTAFVAQTPDGRSARVDLKEGPVLFVAHWCPHCEHFLASTSLDTLPTVVSIWPREGETFEDVVRATKEKLARTGWEDTPFYVLMGEAPDYIEATPTLAWWDGQHIRTGNPLEMDPSDLASVLLSR